MRFLTKILMGAGALVVLLAVLAVGGWYFFLKRDPKPPAAITKTTTVGGGSMDGTYGVAAEDAHNFVGYRGQEQQAAVGGEARGTGPTGEATRRFAIRSMAGEKLNCVPNP